MTIRGWVYVIDNPAMPDILKIGYSTKDPSLRAKELAGTGSPHPFRVVFDVLVENPRAVEQAAHSMLAAKREGKEWFRCSHSEAINAIKTCAKSVLLERNNLSHDGPSAQEFPAHTEEYKCPYHGCGKPAAYSYKGVVYCDEHYKAMRKQRFAFARLHRDG